MVRWLPAVLRQVHKLVAGGKVGLTYKAVRESEAMGLAPDDVCDVLAGLATADSAGRLASRITDEWMYVFKPRVGAEVFYVKLVLRLDCVVVSFHEDEGGAGHEDEDA